MKRRTTTADEKAMFELAFAEARPLRNPAAKKSHPSHGPKATALKGASGVDGKTTERLRRGALEPEARLDLHGMTEAAAHRALPAFLRRCRAQGLRLVLVVTGKGERRKDEGAPFSLGYDGKPRGVLKAAVPRWLNESSLAGVIAGAEQAHRRHGGAGALYVYLRKPL